TAQFQGGPAASYAREMERLSAKESLLLAVSRLPLSCSPSSQNEWPRPAPYCRAGPYESYPLPSARLSI
uniref:Uncharacterized protein n=1 Tax=Aegilops tauschii subsp. strangulata TaxID=200361 RepID=A0A453D3V0_AEGTS